MALPALSQGPLVITPNTVPGGGVGRAYSTKLTSTGSPGTQWSISAGALPPGLSLLAPAQGTAVTIAGTPIVGGNYNFTLKAVDPDLGQETTKQYSMAILQIIVPSPLPTGM